MGFTQHINLEAVDLLCTKVSNFHMLWFHFVGVCVAAPGGGGLSDIKL